MCVFAIGAELCSAFYLLDERYPIDLRFRRDEIRCAHQGVNSFRIWNREISLKGFTPLDRPDMPNVERGKDDRYVHAYPAWHTCFFYFYGWMPEHICIVLMAVIFGFCVKYICDEMFRLEKSILLLWAWYIIGEVYFSRFVQRHIRVVILIVRDAATFIMAFRFACAQRSGQSFFANCLYTIRQ